ncbi:MAG: hypothetical protein FWB80_15140 [Defluviitaleaceae bacterium]|nr:hypothetical protein [Defluviitaleaceae bacterium]
MIDFKEEINKYKPIRPVDDVEEAVKDEILDIMDLLQYISGKASGKLAGGDKVEMP